MRHATLAALALLALVACTTAGLTAAARPLEGGEWRLVELRGQPVPTLDVEAQPFLRFDVDSGRVTGNTGCNLLTGPFTRSDTTLSFGALVTTKRACMEDERNTRESDFLGALQATQRYAIDGDTLTLLNTAGPVARLVPRATS